MKRRPFLASIAALFTAPFVARKVEAKDPRSEVTPEQWAWKAEAERLTATGCRQWTPPTDGTKYACSIDPASPEPDHGSVSIMEVGPDGVKRVQTIRDQKELRVPTSFDGIAIIPIMGSNGLQWFYFVEKTGEQVARPNTDASKYFRGAIPTLSKP